jgi:DNA invertase Pin-like site-specific DNA recombinase
MIIGYARVSTDGQSLDRQQAALRSAGAEKVFAKMSGAKTEKGTRKRNQSPWPWRRTGRNALG